MAVGETGAAKPRPRDPASPHGEAGRAGLAAHLRGKAAAISDLDIYGVGLAPTSPRAPRASVDRPYESKGGRGAFERGDPMTGNLLDRSFPETPAKPGRACQRSAAERHALKTRERSERLVPSVLSASTIVRFRRLRDAWESVPAERCGTR